MKHHKKSSSQSSLIKAGVLLSLVLPIYLVSKFLKKNNGNYSGDFEYLNNEEEALVPTTFDDGMDETKTYTNEQVEKIVGKANLSDLTPRQKRIYAFIEKSNSVEMSKLQKKFKSVTVRTLRRDLKDISDKNLITKIGNTKGVIYTLS